MNYQLAQALHQYGRVDTRSRVESASPHQLTAMLFDGALNRIASARGHMQRHEIAAKGDAISRAIEILSGLRVSLDFEQGGELAKRLDGLYAYMADRLLAANLHDDVGALDEVTRLLHPIRDAWAGIAPAPHAAPAHPAAVARAAALA